MKNCKNKMFFFSIIKKQYNSLWLLAEERILNMKQTSQMYKRSVWVQLYQCNCQKYQRVRRAWLMCSSSVLMKIRRMLYLLLLSSHYDIWGDATLTHTGHRRMPLWLKEAVDQLVNLLSTNPRVIGLIPCSSWLYFTTP